VELREEMTRTRAARELWCNMGLPRMSWPMPSTTDQGKVKSVFLSSRNFYSLYVKRFLDSLDLIDNLNKMDIIWLKTSFYLNLRIDKKES